MGDIIAIIDIEGEHSVEETIPSNAEQTSETIVNQIQVTPTTIQIEDKKIEIPGLNQIQPTLENHQSSIHSGIRFYSPLVKNIASHEGLSQQELDQVAGSGSDGRVTKEDILKYVASKKQQTASAQTNTSPTTTTAHVEKKRNMLLYQLRQHIQSIPAEMKSSRWTVCVS